MPSLDRVKTELTLAAPVLVGHHLLPYETLGNVVLLSGNLIAAVARSNLVSVFLNRSWSLLHWLSLHLLFLRSLMALLNVSLKSSALFVLKSI
jgi:hypothetical protein